MRKTLNNVNLTDVASFSEFDTVLKFDETVSPIADSVTGETVTAFPFTALSTGITTRVNAQTMTMPDLTGRDFAAWVCAKDDASVYFGAVAATARINIVLNAGSNAFRVNTDSAVDPVPYAISTATGGNGNVQKALLIFRVNDATGCKAHVSDIGSKLIQVGTPVTTVGVGAIDIIDKITIADTALSGATDFYMAGIKSWAAGEMPTDAQLILQADWEMERAYAGYKEFYPPALYL